MASETLVKFSATWCQPCKRVAPIWDAAKAVDDDRNYIEFDVDEMTPEALRAWRVSSVPTVVRLDADGNEVDRATGPSVVSLI